MLRTCKNIPLEKNIINGNQDRIRLKIAKFWEIRNISQQTSMEMYICDRHGLYVISPILPVCNLYPLG